MANSIHKTRCPGWKTYLLSLCHTKILSGNQRRDGYGLRNCRRHHSRRLGDENVGDKVYIDDSTFPHSNKYERTKPMPEENPHVVLVVTVVLVTV